MEDEDVVSIEAKGVDKKIEKSQKRGLPCSSVTRKQWNRQGHISTQRLATANGSISQTITFDEEEHEDDFFSAADYMNIPMQIDI